MREKLIELLKEAEGKNIDESLCLSVEELDERLFDGDGYGFYADHLIANGVTVTDNNVGGKWIPVTERLPQPLDWVLCACKSNAVHILRYDHILDDWDMQEANRCYRKEFVTHWMPLPEPPKGE